MPYRILIADDEQMIRESLAFVLTKEKYSVTEVSNGKDALQKQLDQPFDLIISDIEMPGMRGNELLEQVTRQTPETFFIMMTAFASVETAIDALRKGAYDYIIKPLEFEDVIYRIKKLFRHKELLLENKLLRQELNRNYDFDKLIGQSKNMQDVFQLIKRVSQNDAVVLITGKSGTGKELVARAIHFNSRRASKRFVAVNCGAIVPTLFESELFGHKKGSFTGAIGENEGLFRSAEGGTLFLDEVAEIPFHLQAKLLRAIEQREIIPVGSTVPFSVDVRILAATNRDLRQQVAEGKFREDLYYRLNVVDIYLPPLSDRKEDIPLLANFFLEKYKQEMAKPVKGVSNEAMGLLQSYRWKGEVRELENTIERSVIFCDSGLIYPEHLPDHIRHNAVEVDDAGGAKLKDATKRFERQYIIQTLARFKNRKEEAAKSLGISLSSLYRKIDEYKIPDE